MQKEDAIILSTIIECLKVYQKDKYFENISLKYDPSATVIITGINSIFFNSIFIKSPTNVELLINEIHAVQRQLNRPLTLWLTPDTDATNIEDEFRKAFATSGPNYGMLLTLADTNVLPPTSGITIERVNNKKYAEAFAKLLSDIHRLPDLQIHNEQNAIEQYKLDNPICYHYIATVDGVIAGTSSLVLNKHYKESKVGGLFNACVLPEFRNAGIGTAMADHRIAIAKSMGLEYLSIWLMADAMARGYCERLGFQNHQAITPYFLG